MLAEAQTAAQVLPTTLLGLLRRAAQQAPHQPALLAPGRIPLTHAGLLAQVERTGADLRALGLSSADCVAVVVPNGPEMAAAFLGVACAAACAPLNPAYREAEFDFYLADLAARALLVPAGSDSPAVAVARARGCLVLELQAAADAPAGVFTLVGGAPAAPHGAAPEDAPDRSALLLHTSGTTARPKLVPLSQRNLAASAAHVAASLALCAADRCLNVMPLFHIHGLVAGLLASLMAGGSVVATPGFSAPRFFEWLEAFAPTWYTAVPTMHQALLARAQAQPAAQLAGRLRLVRSSSAALPPQVMAGLEAVFGAPVIEAYGMTEAAHQMASNPLPPRARKPRSVGLPAGPELAIMAANGTLLPAGAAAEVVVRGPNLTAGYAANPAANAAAFVEGWFRTGDEGYFDEDGYLFLTGRLKELINRGGEKVAPGEVEAALLDHPAVAEAAVFALPDPRLGEAVGAAVVARAGAALPAERELRRFVAERLADFKVPARVVVVDALPTGATGKVQRLGLAERLGLGALAPEQAPGPYAAPEGEFEPLLAALWGQVLGRERVGRHDRFLALGGDSLLAMQLLARVNAAFAVELTLLDFFDAATVAEQARLVEQDMLAALQAAPPETVPDPPPAVGLSSLLVPMRATGTRLPFFCVHDIGGQVLPFHALAELLGDDQPFYALQAQGLADDRPPHASVELMAADYVRALGQVQPHGPYYLGGYCFGGVVAYEMACQLLAQGETTRLVAIFEGYAPVCSQAGRPRWTRERLRHYAANLPGWLADYRAQGLGRFVGRASHVLRQWSRQALRRLGLRGALQAREIVAEAALLPAAEQAVVGAQLQASGAYSPGPYPGQVTLLSVQSQSMLRDPDPQRGWQYLALGGVEVRRVAGSHHNLLRQPHVASLARELRAKLDETQ